MKILTIFFVALFNLSLFAQTRADLNIPEDQWKLPVLILDERVITLEEYYEGDWPGIVVKECPRLMVEHSLRSA